MCDGRSSKARWSFAMDQGVSTAFSTPHVAGSGRPQRAQCLVEKAADLHAETGDLAGEMRDQGRISTGASASGGARREARAIVQVEAEDSRGDTLAQVLVAGDDHARVHFAWLVGAEPGHTPILQHAQEADLCVEAHRRDLVEQQRAAVGLLELADAIAFCAGEGAFHMAEQLARGGWPESPAVTEARGPFAQRGASWRKRAATSFPVQLSPVAAVVVERATLRSCGRRVHRGAAAMTRSDPGGIRIRSSSEHIMVEKLQVCKTELIFVIVPPLRA